MDTNKTQALGQSPTLDPNRTMMGHAPSLNATVTIKPVQCPVCKTFNPPGMMFCVECGLIFDRALPEDAFGAPSVQLPYLLEQGGREHPVRPGANIVGREGGDITIPDPKVSRRHAQITSDSGAFEIEDLGSTNGTLVNGSRLDPGAKKAISASDKIAFGGFEVQFCLPGGARGGATQSFAGHQTAAISVPPRVEQAPARLMGEGHDHALKPGLNSFGRKPENDVQIADPYVSGKHGIIELTDDGFFLTDTGSTNGTMLNDAKLAANMRTRLTPDDVIRLGSLELRIVPA